MHLSRQRPRLLPPLKSAWNSGEASARCCSQSAPLFWRGHLGHPPPPVPYTQLPRRDLINFILILSLPSAIGLTYPAFPWCQSFIVSNKKNFIAWPDNLQFSTCVLSMELPAGPANAFPLSRGTFVTIRQWSLNISTVGVYLPQCGAPCLPEKSWESIILTHEISCQFPIDFRCLSSLLGLPGGTDDKELVRQCRRHERHGFNP